MLDTCFLLLVSDYIVADGSFRTVVERIQAGRNGILVGNFQVVEEEALPWLTDIQQASPNCPAIQAARADEVGAVAFASRDGREHRELSDGSQRSYQPAVLAGR